jgi:hypothetical protein
MKKRERTGFNVDTFRKSGRRLCTEKNVAGKQCGMPPMKKDTMCSAHRAKADKATETAEEKATRGKVLNFTGGSKDIKALLAEVAHMTDEELRQVGIGFATLVLLDEIKDYRQVGGTGQPVEVPCSIANKLKAASILRAYLDGDADVDEEADLMTVAERKDHVKALLG